MTTSKIENSAVQLASASNVRNIWGGIIINVKSYGAIGDGIQDDTIAIQRAINYAISTGQTEITIPAGTYLYGTLTSTSGITFIGDGVTLDGVTTINLASLSVLNSLKSQVVDLFAMGGQSNMQGQSEGPISFELPIYKALEYKLLTNTLTTVKHPFGETIGGDLLLSANAGWGSLNPKFAESYFNQTNVVPLMVGVAKGGTAIEEWLKTGSRPDRYAKLVEKVNAAATCSTSNGFFVRNKCFVWLQGESDGVNNIIKQTYKARFLTLWNDLKADCGFTTCLIIRVSKFFAYNVLPIIRAQEELAQEYDDIVMLTRITGTFTVANGLMQSIDHYTNAGYDLVGNIAGKAAGEYLYQNHRIPTLEAEPYSELVYAAAGKYEFRFRNNEVTEATGKITSSLIGVPNATATYTILDGNAGIQLGKDMLLDGDATISLTCLYTAPNNIGAMWVAYNGYEVGESFIFAYHAESVINVLGSQAVTGSFFETATIVPELAKYNHYVIHKVGKVYTLYFNNTMIQTVYNGPEILNINSLFYGGGGLGINGRLKHFMINIGSIVAPKLADPLFYSNAEQGTT